MVNIKATNDEIQLCLIMIELYTKQVDNEIQLCLVKIELYIKLLMMIYNFV